MAASTGFNSRDLAGLRDGTGRYIAPRLLYRTDAGRQALPALVRSLSATTPVTLLDLRSIDEVDGCPPSAAAVRVVRAPLHDPEFATLAARERSWKSYASSYLRLLPDAARAAGLAVDLLACGGGPVVIGCRVGKDRTGVTVAATLWALGITPADIVTDYLRTGAAARAAHDTIEQLARARGETPDDILRRYDLPASTLTPALAELDRVTDIDSFLGLSPGRTALARATVLTGKGDRR
jgi:uncharacterized protein (DUF433 family)